MSSPKNKPQKVLTLKKLLKVVNPIKKSAPDSYPTGKPKYPDAYSKLPTMKPSPQKKVYDVRCCVILFYNKVARQVDLTETEMGFIIGAVKQLHGGKINLLREKLPVSLPSVNKKSGK